MEYNDPALITCAFTLESDTWGTENWTWTWTSNLNLKFVGELQPPDVETIKMHFVVLNKKIAEIYVSPFKQSSSSYFIRKLSRKSFQSSRGKFDGSQRHLLSKTSSNSSSQHSLNSKIGELETFLFTSAGLLHFHWNYQSKLGMPPKKEAKSAKGAKDKGGKAAAGGSDDKGSTSVDFIVAGISIFSSIFKAKRRKEEMQWKSDTSFARSKERFLRLWRSSRWARSSQKSQQLTVRTKRLAAAIWAGRSVARWLVLSKTLHLLSQSAPLPSQSTLIPR